MLSKSQQPRTSKLRGRELGLPFPGHSGPFNAITDVPDVEVGFTTLIEDRDVPGEGIRAVRTGVTAILPRGRQNSWQPVWAATYVLNGAGEMTGLAWIGDYGYFSGPLCLTNTHAIGTAHTAACKWMRRAYRDHLPALYNWATPVVTETSDSYLNDMDGFHVTEADVTAAIAAAASGPIAEGNVGGGTGMNTYEFMAGTGTASRDILVGTRRYTVGVLVQSNFGWRPQLTVLGVPAGRHLMHVLPLRATSEIYARRGIRTGDGSIIVIVATDAPMQPLYLQRMARRAAIGISRTGTPGSDYSGDIFLAFSTAAVDGQRDADGIESLDYVRSDMLDPLFTATVEATEEAIINALLAAEPMTGHDGHTSPALPHDELVAIVRRYGRMPAG